MTKRQLVKWLEAKQSDAKAEVEIQYATAEKAYFAQRDEALKINETVDEVFRLISEADTVANRWKEALESWTKLTSQKSWAMWRGISQLPPTLSATTSRRCCR